MDKDTVDTIIQLNKEQNEYFKELLNSKNDNDNLKFKAIHRNIDAGFEAMQIELHNQNERISKVEKQTSWWRTFQKHPKMTLFVLIIFLIGGLVLFGIDIDGSKITHFLKELKFW